MTTQQLENIELDNLLEEGNLFQIQSTFAPPGNSDPSFDLYLISLEQLLEKIIPKSVYDQILQQKDDHELEKCFHQLNKNLPYISYSFSQKTPYTLYIATLSHSQYTHGVGRFLCDMLSRWLIPGKQLPIVGQRSMDFRFLKCSRYRYFIQENFVRISDESELNLVKNNLPGLIDELKINILAVYHARYIVSLKSLSLEQKAAMMQENISSFLKIPKNSMDQSVFDQMQQLLFKLSSEEKIKEVKNNVAYLMHSRPKTFDSSVFYEVRQFLLLLNDQFIFERDVRHISRIIAFQYLFKKTLKQSIRKIPNERHISFKLFKAHLQRNSSRLMCLGILIAINLHNDAERIEKKHILEAVKSLIPNVQYVSHSLIASQEEGTIRLFYFEVKKSNDVNFSFDEIKKLKKNLPNEIKSRVENVVHSLFMPRNEEEVIRNIIILSKQLKYVKDLPHAIISYDRQNDSEISFLVILLRLMHKKTPSLKELFKKASTEMTFSLDESKIVGYLKRKYPKEANIFRISLNKTSFFRKDYSLDLQKARQKVTTELVKIIGEFRDYNGGIIIKQSEALNHLRNLLKKENIKNDFLLENFFYSLKPRIMQSILNPLIIKSSFKMLLDAIEYDFDQEMYYIKTSSEKNYFVILIAATSSNIKQEIQSNIQSLNLHSMDLITSYLNIYDITTLTYFYRSEDKKKRDLFYKSVLKGLSRWNKKFCCSIDSD